MKRQCSIPVFCLLLLRGGICGAQQLLTSGSASFYSATNKSTGLRKGEIVLDYNKDSVRTGLFAVDTFNKKKPLGFTRRLHKREIKSTSLYGNLTKVSGDTVFFTLVPLLHSNNPVFNKPEVVNESDNKKSFIYIVPKSQPKLHIPYSNWALATTTIPLRVGINRQGDTQSSFLNANLALFRVWGTSILQPHSNVKFRNRYFGVGPFVGPTRTTGKVDGEEVGRLGMIYGANAIVGVGGVNLILAAGGEADGSSVTKKFTPWVGFGIGIKLVDLPTTGEKVNTQK